MHIQEIINEVGLTVYPRLPPDTKQPSGKFILTIESSFNAHPQIKKFVDLTLTVMSQTVVEITFIETEKQRLKGHAGAVFDLLINAADTFKVTLKLHAYSRDGSKLTRTLDQDRLEAFYTRRGFEIIDSSDKNRWMIRHPHEN